MWERQGGGVKNSHVGEEKRIPAHLSGKEQFPGAAQGRFNCYPASHWEIGGREGNARKERGDGSD